MKLTDEEVMRLADEFERASDWAWEMSTSQVADMLRELVKGDHTLQHMIALFVPDVTLGTGG